jgi:hypothetical protein
MFTPVYQVVGQNTSSTDAFGGRTECMHDDGGRR